MRCVVDCVTGAAGLATIKARDKQIGTVHNVSVSHKGGRSTVTAIIWPYHHLLDAVDCGEAGHLRIKAICATMNPHRVAVLGCDLLQIGAIGSFISVAGERYKHIGIIS